MERLRVGVVDRSPTIRETVAIVLHDCQVDCWTPEEFGRLTPPYTGNVLVVDDEAVDAATVAAKAPGVPVLWLRSEGASLPNLPGVLSRAFRPSELRQKIRALLELQRTEQELLARSGFPPPLFPPALVPSLLAAARTLLPVFISGEPGSGHLRLARLLHQLRGTQHFLSARAATFDRPMVAELEQLGATGTVTLFLENIETLPASSQALLRELLEHSGAAAPYAHGTLRVISASTLTRDALEERAVLEPGSFYLLTAFSFHLPALRERRDELPGIVQVVARQLTESLALPPASFTPAAIQRLQNYLWFGNLAELETVLARTLTLVSHRPVDASDLLFGYGPIPDAAPARQAESRPQANGSFDAIHQVEVLVNELAHEVKNPLVTIKTISQHLERLLENASGREQVAQLAGEAVHKIDQVIENLLRYSRFREPAKQATTINSIVGPILSDLAPLLSERRVVLNYLPPDPVPILADREQLCFALENLLRAIVRDLDEQETLTIEPVPARPALRIRVPRPHAGLAERLSSFVGDHPAARGPVEPLGFLIARSLLRRNGGSIEVGHEGEQMVVTVEFPSGEGTKRGYGETTSSHRG